MIVKGSVHIGNFIYVRCVSDSEDTVGDIRFYPSGDNLLVEKCTVANAAKGGGIWVATGETGYFLPEATEGQIAIKGETEWEAEDTEELPTEEFPFVFEHKSYGLLIYEL